MQLRTSIYDYESPIIFNRFRELIGEKYWTNRVSKLKQEIRGNRFLEEHYHSENSIAYELDKCSQLVKRQGSLPTNAASQFNLYTALSFASQCLSMIDLLDEEKKAFIIRRVRGCFKNPEDMRAIQLELATSVHFSRLGYSISWPEFDGQGTFDLLVNDIGPKGLEVECKSFNADKGNVVSYKSFLRFCNLLAPRIIKLSEGLESGLSILLTVQNKLPDAVNDLKTLCSEILKSVITNSRQTTGDTNISITHFDSHVLLANTYDKHAYQNAIESITGARNKLSITFQSRSGNPILFVVQSRQDDRLLDYTHKVAKQAAERQFSGKNPSLILIEFNGLSPQEMIDLANEDNHRNDSPSKLKVWVSEFLSNNSKRNHVIGVGFMSKGEIYRPTQSTVSNSGSVYMFPKRESPMWSDEFNGLFS